MTTSATLTLPNPSLVEGRSVSVPYYTDEALFEACGVRIAFTTRQGGVSTGAYSSLNVGSHVNDDAQLVIQNRARIMAELGAADFPVLVPKQVHEDTVCVVESLQTQAVQSYAAAIEAGCDAIVLEQARVAAMLCFADCVPVIAVLPTKDVAVIHAGWRGVDNLISVKTVQIMAKRAARRVLAEAATVAQDEAHLARMLLAQANIYIGPYIHQECFETSAEVHNQFVQKFGDICSFDETHINLGTALRVQLERVGVNPARICDLDACTVCDVRQFFSFRAQDGIAGRHAAVAFRM